MVKIVISARESMARTNRKIQESKTIINFFYRILDFDIDIRVFYYMIKDRLFFCKFWLIIYLFKYFNIYIENFLKF